MFGGRISYLFLLGVPPFPGKAGMILYEFLVNSCVYTKLYFVIIFVSFLSFMFVVRKIWLQNSQCSYNGTISFLIFPLNSSNQNLLKILWSKLASVNLGSTVQRQDLCLTCSFRSCDQRALMWFELWNSSQSLKSCSLNSPATWNHCFSTAPSSNPLKLTTFRAISANNFLSHRFSY